MCECCHSILDATKNADCWKDGTQSAFAVKIKYVINIDQRHLNKPKTAHDITWCDITECLIFSVFSYSHDVVHYSSIQTSEMNLPAEDCMCDAGIIGAIFNFLAPPGFSTDINSIIWEQIE